MRRSAVRLAAVGMGSLLALTACGGADSGEGGGDGNGDEPLRVGVFGPASVPQGIDVRDGAQLAADQINEEGGAAGRDIEVVFCDSVDGASPDAAVSCVNDFITREGVDAVVGGFSSGETLAVLDVIDRAQVPYLSTGAAAPEVVQGPDGEPRQFVFRAGPVNSTRLAADACLTMVTRVAPATGFTRFGILAEDTEFNRALVPFLEQCLPNPSAATDGRIPVEQGVELVGTQRHLPDASDFSSQFQALESAGAQFVVELNSRQEGVAIGRQWGQLQPNFALGGINVAGQATGYFEATGGNAAFQLNGPGGVTRDEISERTIPFFDDFEEAHGREPIYNGAAAFDAMLILADAIERAGTSETQEVVTALEDTDFQGVQGRITFEDHDLVYGAGDPEAGVNPVYFQFTEDGEKRVVFPEAIADGEEYQIPPWVQP
jgi:branched-chain amino acid transport system substrate-binding protein